MITLTLSASAGTCSSAEPQRTVSGSKCGQCAFRDLCLPVGLSEQETLQLDRIISRRRRVARDEPLYQSGKRFDTLYAVRFGHFKTACIDARGDQHITGFHMAGDVIGMDAIGTGSHDCSAMALEDSEVCEIPYARLQGLLVQMPHLMAHFHRMMGREIVREQSVMLFLSNMRADQRIANFMIGLSQRYLQRGLSPRRFQLRMSREDMGAYLGLTVECISRQLARFRANGWIVLDRRELEITDMPALLSLTSDGSPAPEPLRAAA
jgi:CRP/FNR family transcriptional regulator